MWKDFFSFTKRERITIVVVFVSIVLVQGLIWTSDTWVLWLPKAAQKRYAQEQALRAYIDSVHLAKSTAGVSPAGVRFQERQATLKRMPFNPNTADSTILLQAGLKPWMVKNILKYRSKGGRYRNAEDFSRVYGLDATRFEQLKPYLRFDETDHSEALNATTNPATNRASLAVGVESSGAKGLSAEASNTSIQTEKLAETRLSTLNNPVLHSIDLNSTDTAQLQQIKGVGAVTADRIAKYRKQLGGFYSLAQLDEVKGMYPETLQRLKSMLRVDPNRIFALDANKASLEKLREHPYISFWQAKVIVDLRKARGAIRSLGELASFKEFKPDDLERLKWYLVF